MSDTCISRPKWLFLSGNWLLHLPGKLRQGLDPFEFHVSCYCNLVWRLYNAIILRIPIKAKDLLAFVGFLRHYNLLILLFSGLVWYINFRQQFINTPPWFTTEWPTLIENLSWARISWVSLAIFWASVLLGSESNILVEMCLCSLGLAGIEHNSYWHGIGSRIYDFKVWYIKYRSVLLSSFFVFSCLFSSIVVSLVQCYCQGRSQGGVREDAALQYF